MTGPPEHYRPENRRSQQMTIQVSFKADVWSLGALLSEACTWVVSGLAGMEAYRKMRCTSRFDVSFADEDCFHDGTQVLEVVHDQHKYLRENVKKHDYLTGYIIDDLIPLMLTVVSV